MARPLAPSSPVEINVTSPAGIQEIDRFDGVCLESDLWDVFEERFEASRN